MMRKFLLSIVNATLFDGASDAGWLLFCLAVGFAIPLLWPSKQGLARWQRVLLLAGLFALAHWVQMFVPMRGFPGFMDLAMFPLVGRGLQDQYYMHFAYVDWRQVMSPQEANLLGWKWGMLHAVLIWGIVASGIFMWVRLAPPKTIAYGDAPVSPEAGAGTPGAGSAEAPPAAKVNDLKVVVIVAGVALVVAAVWLFFLIQYAESRRGG